MLIKLCFEAYAANCTDKGVIKLVTISLGLFLQRLRGGCDRGFPGFEALSIVNGIIILIKKNEGIDSVRMLYYDDSCAIIVIETNK